MKEKKVYISEAKQLHNREFYLEEWNNGEWVSKGEVSIFQEEMFVNQTFLKNAHYYEDQNVIKYSFGVGKAHKSGMLCFDEQYMSFVGSYSNSDGTVTMLRGNQKEVTYKTTETLDDKKREAPDFTIGTKWNEQGLLEAYYKLGDVDITEGTAVTEISSTWETTIERTSWGLIEYDFTFSIVVDFTGTKFKGTSRHIEENMDWTWTGEAILNTEALLTKRNQLCSVSARLLQREDDLGGMEEPTLQNLLNISQYIFVTDEKTGEKVLVDLAQQETGIYFQDSLINSLPEETIKQMFGSKRVLPSNVETTRKKYESFYKEKSIINLGQLLHETFLHSGTEEDKEAAKKINIEKIRTDWQDTSKKPEFAEQANALYCNAYENKVTDLAKYLDKRQDWATKLYQLVISDAYLNIWRAQIASSQFSNVKQHIYEIYTKLTVLDSSEQGMRKAQDAVSTMFATVLNVTAQKMNWVEEYREQFVKFLKDAMENMRTGNIEELKNILEQKNAEEIRKYLNSLISTYDSIDQLIEDIVDLLAFTSVKKEASGRAVVEIVDIAVDSARNEERFLQLAEGFGKVGWKEAGKLLKVLGYSGMIGLCFSLFTSSSGAKNIVAEVSLSICATVFLVKGSIAFLETALGKWIVKKIGSISERTAEFCESFGKWFSSEGEIAGKAAKIFGKNAEAFMKTRLGPVCAIATIVLTGFFLNDAIKHHDTFNIVMESINMAFAVADLTMIGLSMLSFSWAGPVGVALGIIGGVVIVFQLLYNLFCPPKHEQDCIERFIYGPLNEAGYVCG